MIFSRWITQVRHSRGHQWRPTHSEVETLQNRCDIQQCELSLAIMNSWTCSFASRPISLLFTGGLGVRETSQQAWGFRAISFKSRRIRRSHHLVFPWTCAHCTRNHIWMWKFVKPSFVIFETEGIPSSTVNSQNMQQQFPTVILFVVQINDTCSSWSVIHKQVHDLQVHFRVCSRSCNVHAREHACT